VDRFASILSTLLVPLNKGAHRTRLLPQNYIYFRDSDRVRDSFFLSMSLLSWHMGEERGNRGGNKFQRGEDEDARQDKKKTLKQPK
jgi:hypothetical protein